MPRDSTRCLRISGSRSCALAGRVIGAITSGLSAFSRATSVERSEGGSGHGITSSSSSVHAGFAALYAARKPRDWFRPKRSEEHTSELQSRFDLVCRLLLEKKKPVMEYLTELHCAHD